MSGPLDECEEPVRPTFAGKVRDRGKVERQIVGQDAMQVCVFILEMTSWVFTAPGDVDAGGERIDPALGGADSQHVKDHPASLDCSCPTHCGALRASSQGH